MRSKNSLIVLVTTSQKLRQKRNYEPTNNHNIISYNNHNLVYLGILKTPHIENNGKMPEVNF